MFLADKAFILFTETPLQASVFYKELWVFWFIILYTLVKYQLRIINNSWYHKLVYLVILNPADSLRHLTRINRFKIIHNLLMFP